MVIRHDIQCENREMDKKIALVRETIGDKPRTNSASLSSSRLDRTVAPQVGGSSQVSACIAAGEH